MVGRPDFFGLQSVSLRWVAGLGLWVLSNTDCDFMTRPSLLKQRCGLHVVCGPGGVADLGKTSHLRVGFLLLPGVEE